MSDPRQGGGSSEPNGPNETANDAARDAGLDRDQQRELHDALQSYDGQLDYNGIRDLADDIKNGG